MAQILLDRNENQYGPSPACYRVLQEAKLEQLSLYSREFTRGRKSELSQRLADEHGIPEERVLLSYGSEDMLKQVVHCYLHQGERMLLPQQSWWYYKKIAKEVHGDHIEYPLYERGFRFEFDVDEIIALHRRYHPHLILIASPNNPTGTTMYPKDLARLVEACSSSYIVLDQAYFGFRGNAGDSLKDLLDAHSRLVVLRTFSKYYALAGLRIGYACVGTDLAHLIEFSARYLGYNQLTERIALAALSDKQYYERIAQRMREDTMMYFEELNKLEGFKAFESDANFILVRYPAHCKKSLQEGLQQRGIAVKFLEDPGVTDCMRITIGTREQNRYVLKALQDIAAQLQIAATTVLE
ncbi:MAG TPA: histidinol-phosphate transaminase [Bacteroidota bacterium]|nr:histidinol-phosphate transaminase [Bacteroidota bacterium]